MFSIANFFLSVHAIASVRFAKPPRRGAFGCTGRPLALRGSISTSVRRIVLTVSIAHLFLWIAANFEKDVTALTFRE